MRLSPATPRLRPAMAMRGALALSQTLRMKIETPVFTRTAARTAL